MFWILPAVKFLLQKTELLKPKIFNTGNLWIRAKALASAIGQIQSMKNALVFNVDLMTKFSHMCVESKASWSSEVLMSSNVVDEINFWLQNIRIKNGQSSI